MGILVIVVLVVLARWTGDRIREKFLTPKPVIETQTTQTNQTAQTTQNVAQEPPKVSTYSVIPSTGPKEEAYLLFAFLAVSGIASLKLARRLSS